MLDFLLKTDIAKIKKVLLLANADTHAEKFSIS
jgi:hypothetical protein